MTLAHVKQVPPYHPPHEIAYEVNGDVPQATRERWAEYRQALRDITLQDGFPAAVKWPEPPN